MAPSPHSTNADDGGGGKRGRGRRKHTIAEGLLDLGVTVIEAFAGCETREEEFRVVKKHYFVQALRHHPDKGGDAAAFRRIQTSFELLRDLHTGRQKRQQQQRRRRSNDTAAADEWLFSECLEQPRQQEQEKRDNGTVSAKKKDDEYEANDVDGESFDMSGYDGEFAKMETPSWEYYSAAAEEAVPLYHVELAKSGRSKCTQRPGKHKKCLDGPTMEKGLDSGALVDPGGAPERIFQNEIRVGWLNEQSGTYGGWKHLRCWRVPHKVWLGLPDPDTGSVSPEAFAAALTAMNECVLTGFVELPERDQRAFVDHCRNKLHWASRRGGKSSKKSSTQTISSKDAPSSDIISTQVEGHEPWPIPSGHAASESSTALVPATASTKATTLAPGRERFVMPRPGKNGASDATVFRGKTFVMTGIFPEVGGGAGLSLGKAKVKTMIESFGGRVTGSVSGKTDVLVVGKDPGMSKVSQARRRAPDVLLASLRDLKLGLDQGCCALEDFDAYNRDEPMKIQSFSMRYQYAASGYNGLVLQASKSELAIAQGLKPHRRSKAKEEKEDTSTLTMKLEDGHLKKPATKKSKRKALKDVAANKAQPTDDIQTGASTRKRRKTSIRAKKIGNDSATDTAIVVADKKNKSKPRKTSTTKNKKKKAGNDRKNWESPSATGEYQEVITCDLCGAVCTEQSWFLATKGDDICPVCFDDAKDSNTMESAVMQRRGQTVH